MEHICPMGLKASLFGIPMNFSHVPRNSRLPWSSNISSFICRRSWRPYCSQPQMLYIISTKLLFGTKLHDSNENVLCTNQYYWNVVSYLRKVAVWRIQSRCLAHKDGKDGKDHEMSGNKEVQTNRWVVKRSDSHLFIVASKNLFWAFAAWRQGVAILRLQRTCSDGLRFLAPQIFGLLKLALDESTRCHPLDAKDPAPQTILTWYNYYWWMAACITIMTQSLMGMSHVSTLWTTTLASNAPS